MCMSTQRFEGLVVAVVDGLMMKCFAVHALCVRRKILTFDTGGLT